MNCKPILSIAIPTYNRASILDGSLRVLLPQINEHKSDVEFIITDNASEDNTQEVINTYKKQYSDLNFITHLQTTNTGFFGNFLKCRELSNGKYFWLLSDNEQISNGFIDFLVRNIKSNKTSVGALFLSHVEVFHHDTSAIHTSTFKYSDTEFGYLVNNYTAYELTLVSTVIMLNDKTYDNEAVKELKNNLFLGFIFLCNALRINTGIRIINGSIYKTVPCVPHYDMLKAFTKDIMECVGFYQKSGLLNEEQIKQFVTGFLKTNIINFVRYYIVTGSLNGYKYGSIENVKRLLDLYYSDYAYYRNNICPLFNSKRVFVARIEYRIKLLVKRIMPI